MANADCKRVRAEEEAENIEIEAKKVKLAAAAVEGGNDPDREENENASEEENEIANENAREKNEAGENASDGEENDNASEGENYSDDEETPEDERMNDPGVAVYGVLRNCLRQLADAASLSEQNEESIGRMKTVMETLKGKVVASPADKQELPNAQKLLQMNLKNVLFNSKDIKDVLNIKNFVSDLEDSSAARSEGDDRVFTFLAKHATELWYQWNEDTKEWEWTPEADHWLWMPCSTNVVSAGDWKGEIPAPENVQIISYLNMVRPQPYDQQYISPAFDIASLLGQLKELGDERISSGVRGIAGAVLALEHAPSEVDVVRETVDRFRALLD